MKNMAKLFVLSLVLIVAVAAYASAVNLNIESVEINNRDVTEAMGHTNNYQYHLGDKLDIDVCVRALTDVTNAQIDADIYGYQYSVHDTNKVTDSTDTFDLSENDNECHTLNIIIPDRMDKDYYKLRIRVGDRDGVSYEKEYELHISGIARSAAVQIKDFALNPEEIIAGRAFTTMVKVKNLGNNDLQDLKVTVSIPDLNVKVSEYMDSLDADQSKTFEELLLRVPDCTKPGKYDVEMKVEFDEYEETSQTGVITVKSGDGCTAGSDNTGTNDNNNNNQPEKTVITVPSSQEMTQGTSGVFPIMIGNSGSQSKTYTL